MASRGYWRGIILALAAAPCVAQQGVDAFLGVKNWHGTLKMTGTASGSSNGGPISDVWQFGVTNDVTFQLDTYNPQIQGWTGTFKGTSNLNAQDVETLGDCKITFLQTFQGTLGAGKTFTMRLQGANQYVFYPSDYQVQGATSTTSTSCAPGTQTGTGPVSWSPVLSDKIQTLPASGFSLTGSQTVLVDSPLQPVSLLFGGTPAQTKVTITWDIEPGLVTESEVVVTKSPELQNWRPEGGANGARGNSVNLVAKLQAKGGGPTNVVAAYFTWEFTNCSKEPGYLLNAPTQNPSEDFDLKFESGPDGLILFDANAQKAQSKAGEQTQSTVTIASYDWGGFGTVKVTAYLPDTTTLVGYLEGDPSQTEIRVPLRQANSSIADVWKKNNGVAGKADTADDETSPQGDGSPGDGLTLYEEYRGFLIDGQRVEGNLTKKDYFILNKAGQSYQPAFKLFQQLSGLEVHYQNYNQGAHRVDQHGIIVNPIAANAKYAKAIGGPGTPASISQVVTPTILPTTPSYWQNYLQPSLAHELFHACNVYHHGDAPYSLPTVLRLPTDVVVALGRPITFLTEAGTPAASMLPVNVPKDLSIGLANDPHTGDDNCVMRYDDSDGYYSKSDGNTIYYTPGEPAGLGICTSAVGTGINDAGRLPQARYGDAAPGRGNCLGQLLVNDAVRAPRR